MSSILYNQLAFWVNIGEPVLNEQEGLFSTTVFSSRRALKYKLNLLTSRGIA